MAMPMVLALTAKPIIAGVVLYARTKDGRIACAANRSTSVRKLIKPIMTRRTAAPCLREGDTSAMPRRRFFVRVWIIGFVARLERRYMLSSGFISGARISAESRTAGFCVLFFHQWASGPNSEVTSPASCSIGTAQVLRYSVMDPSMT